MSRIINGLKRFAKEVDAEAVNQVGRGASEIANALFTGQAFVLYGHKGSHSQERPSPEVSGPEIQGHRESRGR